MAPVAALGILGAAAGIGASAHSSSVPALEKPNGTIEQVAHNVGYQSELGKLTLTGAFTATLSPALGQTQPQHLDVWNFTSADVSPKTIIKIAEYLVENVAGNQRTYRFPIITGARVGSNGNIIYQTQTIAVHAEPSGATWHDMLVVPPDAPSVPGVPAGYDATLRLQLPNSLQPKFELEAISVVHDVKNIGNGGAFSDLKAGEATELCQNLVKFVPDTTVAGVSEGGLSIEVQEIGCNMDGNVLDGVLRGMGYDQYAKDNSYYVGMLAEGSTTVTIPTVSREKYLSTQHYFAG